MKMILLFVSIIWSSINVYQSDGKLANIGHMRGRTRVWYSINIPEDEQFDIYATSERGEVHMFGSDDNGTICEGWSHKNSGTCVMKRNRQSQKGAVRLKVSCSTELDCTRTQLVASAADSVTKVSSMTRNIGHMGSPSRLWYIINFAGDIGVFDIYATFEQGGIHMLGSDDNGEVCEGWSTCVQKTNLQSINGVVRLRVSCSGSDCTSVSLHVFAEQLNSVTKVPSITRNIGHMGRYNERRYYVNIAGDLRSLKIYATSEQGRVRMLGSDDNGDVCAGWSNESPYTCVLKPNVQSINGVFLLKVICYSWDCTSVSLLIFAERVFSVSELASMTKDIGFIRRSRTKRYRIRFNGKISSLDIKVYYSGNGEMNLEGRYDKKPFPIGKGAEVICEKLTKEYPVTCPLKASVKRQTSSKEYVVSLLFICWFENCRSVKLVVYADGIKAITKVPRPRR